MSHANCLHIGDNLHEMSNSIPGKTKKNYLELSSAKNLPRVLIVK